MGSKTATKVKRVVGLEEAEPIDYNQKRVRLICMYPAELRITGKVSGETYVCPYPVKGTRSIEVDERDVDQLLAYRIGGPICCGATNRNSVFVKE